MPPIDNWLTIGAIGAFLGMFATVWGRTKDIAWRVMGVCISRSTIIDRDAHYGIIEYLLGTYSMSGNYEKVYMSNLCPHRDGAHRMVIMEVLGRRLLVFWKWKIIPLVVSAKDSAEVPNYRSRSQETGGYSLPNSTDFSVTYIYPRWLINFDSICLEAVKHKRKEAMNIAQEDKDFMESTRSRFAIFKASTLGQVGATPSSMVFMSSRHLRPIGSTREELGNKVFHRGNALERLIFDDDVRDLITEMRRWSMSQDWYAKHSIPWKRGWMLHGPPGTGKSALARAFAEDLNIPIYVFDLGEMDNRSFTRSWGLMVASIPTDIEGRITHPVIALFEDIDNVFDGRENLTAISKMSRAGMQLLRREDPDSPPPSVDNSNPPQASMVPYVTFDCLLNVLDGVQRIEGVFTIFTTNNLDKVDPALASEKKGEDSIGSRPGRIDRVVHLGFMTRQNKVKMASRLLGDFPEALEPVLAYIEGSGDETPAQFQEFCTGISLKAFWTRRDNESKSEAVQNPGVVEQKQ